MIDRDQQNGVVLFMVLVLLGVLGLVGVGALKNSLTQLNISSQFWQLEKGGVALVAAIDCVLADMISEGFLSYDNSIVTESILPSLLTDVGIKTDGCQKKDSEEGIRYHHINHVNVVTFHQYCGESDALDAGSDIGFFKEANFLVTAVGFDEYGERLSPLIKQAFAKRLPMNRDSFEEQVSQVGSDSDIRYVGQRSSCRSGFSLSI